VSELRHAPQGPHEAGAAKRMAFIEAWCERNGLLNDPLVPCEVVIGLASEAGHSGRLSPEYVSTRLARWK
jgi:hypothetical protein